MTDPLAAERNVGAVAAHVQAAFERLRSERMAGLPFLNDAVRVELVGLRRWRGLWLGVLVTPWFMNLLLLPGDGPTESGEPAACWPDLAFGESATFAFPAGRFEFIAGHEAETGRYLTCSLFSPMFEFVDHDTARQTALACLVALFDSGAAVPALTQPQAIPPALSRRGFLRGRRPVEPAAVIKARR